MKMRTFIKLKTPSKSIRGTFHARYISERERDPGSEEPESRPLFTHDRDGLKYKAADRYLTGGERKNARSNKIQHVIIAFNSHDARELQKLEIAPNAYAPAGEHSRRGESSKIELSDESANLEHSLGGRDRWRSEELAAAHRVQIVHDRPYAEAVRRMMRNLEESAGLSDLRYVMAVHRHTDKTHVHLLLRREYTDRETGEKRMLHRLPETFLNGRDEQGKARGGLLDVALSDALDTMIPRRRAPAAPHLPTRRSAPIARPTTAPGSPSLTTPAPARTSLVSPARYAATKPSRRRRRKNLDPVLSRPAPHETMPARTAPNDATGSPSPPSPPRARAPRHTGRDRQPPPQTPSNSRTPLPSRPRIFKN